MSVLCVCVCVYCDMQFRGTTDLLLGIETYDGVFSECVLYVCSVALHYAVQGY